VDASVQKVDRRFVLRFERYLRYPIETVWAALTEPEQVRQWLAEIEFEPVPGGSHILRFDNTGHELVGRVLEYDPPRVFEHTFGDESNGIVRWELEPVGDECRLVLKHTVEKPESLASFASGWHTHLAMMADLLDGSPRPWDWDEWNANFARYSEQLGPEASKVVR
jgi:uncharacterized protein YndB with AHSA1/START domain